VPDHAVDIRDECESLRAENAELKHQRHQHAGHAEELGRYRQRDRTLAAQVAQREAKDRMLSDTRQELDAAIADRDALRAEVAGLRNDNKWLEDLASDLVARFQEVLHPIEAEGIRAELSSRVNK
jgi:predicted  nucleic acid-binding Zn-ribbon protein